MGRSVEQLMSQHARGLDYWETPTDLFKRLDDIFHFTLDAAASDSNHKCDRYFTVEQNALIQDWRGETVFANPPYSSKSTGEWSKKAYEESLKPWTTVVLLLPTRLARRSSAKYFSQAEIWFITLRLHYEIDGVPSPTAAPFEAMIVILGEKARPGTFKFIPRDRKEKTDDSSKN